MAQNHYLVLGVARNATPEEIKAAYRRQVKQLHPDYYGQDCKPFIALQEAYDVLSDPERRRRYDEQLDRPPAARPVPPGPARTTQAPVEPLIPLEEPLVRDPVGFSFPAYRSPVETSFEHLWADFDSLFGRNETVELDLILTPAEARRGGRVCLRIPVETNCRVCHGRGRVSWYKCASCGGRGLIVQEYPVWLTFPAGITGHQVARLPLDRLGLWQTDLVVHFRVG